MLRSNLYRLSTTTFPKAFPRLIETIVRKGHKIKILCNVLEEMQYFDNILWTFSSLAFIPHGTALDPDPDKQPVLLTLDHETNLNNADVLFCNFKTDIASHLNIKVIASMLPETEENEAINQHVQFLRQVSTSVTIFKEQNGSWVQ